MVDRKRAEVENKRKKFLQVKSELSSRESDLMLAKNRVSLSCIISWHIKANNKADEIVRKVSEIRAMQEAAAPKTEKVKKGKGKTKETPLLVSQNQQQPQKKPEYVGR